MNQVLHGWTTPPPAARLVGCILGLKPDDFAAYHETMNLLEDDPDLRALVIHLAAESGQQLPSVSRVFQRVGPDRILRQAATRLVSDLAGREGWLDVEPDPWVDGVIATAAWMECLAKQCRWDSSQAYVLGMVHCLGQAAVGHFLQKIKPQVGPRPLGEAAELLWERREVAIDSIQATYLILRSWGFDERLAAPARMQQHPLLSTTHRLPAALIRLGRSLAYKITGWSLPLLGPAHQRELLDVVGLDMARVDALAPMVRQHYLGLRECLPPTFRPQPLMRHA